MRPKLLRDVHASDMKWVKMEHFGTVFWGWRLQDRRPTAALGDAASSAPQRATAARVADSALPLHPRAAAEEAYQPESPARRERSARGQTGAGTVLESSPEAHPGTSVNRGGVMVACEGMLAGPSAKTAYGRRTY